jgi:hypothetical protein
VRRSIIPMLVAGSALSTPLTAQSAVGIGVAATVGGSWQIEALDLGYVQAVHAGPLRWASVGGRFGSFVDEGAITGGTRGFVGALVLQTRTGLVRIADVGNESKPSPLGFDVTFEAVGYAGANTPWSQIGSEWGAFSVLPGVRFGDSESVRSALLIGPTVLFGQATEVRAFVALRFELPMVHRKRQP